MMVIYKGSTPLANGIKKQLNEDLLGIVEGKESRVHTSTPEGIA